MASGLDFLEDFRQRTGEIIEDLADAFPVRTHTSGGPEGASVARSAKS